LKKFTLALASPAAEKIGWEFKADEDYLTVQLRKLLIGMAGFAGHERWVPILPVCGERKLSSLFSSIVTEAKQRFDLWASGKDKSAVHTNLRSAIFGITIAEGGRDKYDSVKEEYIKTDSVDGKEICLAALGRVTDADLVYDYLDFVFSDKVAIQDVHNGAVALAANSKVRHLLWEYMKRNWDAVEARLSANNVVFERFVRMGLSKFADHNIGADIASFFKNKDTSPYDRALVIVADSIRTNANYKERDERLVLEWLQSHGYA
jgi:hypothetical protein